MVTKKERLHQLIKSLSKAEKRYFKVYNSAKSESTNYVKLFDAIDKQDIYDESAIKDVFKDSKFVRQLHVTKNQLIKLILKSLRNYHSSISVESELNLILRNIELLFRKELFGICLDELKRAEKLAKDYEKFSAHLQLLVWKRKLLMAKSSRINSRYELDTILTEENELINKRKRLNEYWFLISKISDVFKGNEKWETITKEKIFKNIKHADSHQSRILYYHLHYTHKLTTGKPNKAIQVLNQLVSFIESYPHRIKDDPSSYITALNNKIGHLLTYKDYKPIESLIKTIKSIPDRYNIKHGSSITVKLMIRSYNVELEMYRDLKNWDEGIKKIDEILLYLKNYSASIPDMYKILFYYQFAYIFFNKENLSESLKWTNEILHGKFKESREDILSYARFLNLIIHFEFNNIYVLRYAVESTRRFLRKKRNLHAYEKTLLKFFAKISTSTKSDHKTLLIKLKESLFAGIKEREKNEILDYLDYESWIEQKLSEQR
jgi:tetratricopeptide (TPR) repeat protein